MKRFIFAALFAVTLLSVHRAEAAPGIRLGLTDDPDTLTAGFFYELPASRLGRSAFLSLEPGVDVGFGDDVDFFTLRGTFNLKFIFVTGRAQLYPLLGLSVFYINVDNGGSDTGVGVNLGGGVQFDRFSFELWGGIKDVPDITFLFGIAF